MPYVASVQYVTPLGNYAEMSSPTQAMHSRGYCLAGIIRNGCISVSGSIFGSNPQAAAVRVCNAARGEHFEEIRNIELVRVDDSSKYFGAFLVVLHGLPILNSI